VSWRVNDIVGSIRSTVCGTNVPTAVIRSSDSTAFVRFRSNSPSGGIRFQLNFSSSVEGSFNFFFLLPPSLYITCKPILPNYLPTHMSNSCMWTIGRVGLGLSPVSTTRVDGPELTAASWWVTGFYYGPCWRVRVSTSRVDGPSTRLVETRARQHGPCCRVMETGHRHPSTRAVNSSSGNRALVYCVYYLVVDQLLYEKEWSWICIAPHCEKLTSEALRHGSHSCYTANSPYPPLPRKRSPDVVTTV